MGLLPSWLDVSIFPADLVTSPLCFRAPSSGPSSFPRGMWDMWPVGWIWYRSSVRVAGRSQVKQRLGGVHSSPSSRPALLLSFRFLMTRCCKRVVCSVRLCSNSKDRQSAWTTYEGEDDFPHVEFKRKTIQIQMKSVPVFKSSQVRFVLIIWKAAGSDEKDGGAKKDILLDECQEERRIKAGKEDNEITMRKNQLQTSLMALLLRFINMNVLMKIDEHYQRDTRILCRTGPG